MNKRRRIIAVLLMIASILMLVASAMATDESRDFPVSFENDGNGSLTLDKPAMAGAESNGFPDSNNIDANGNLTFEMPAMASAESNGFPESNTTHGSENLTFGVSALNSAEPHNCEDVDPHDTVPQVSKAFLSSYKTDNINRTLTIYCLDCFDKGFNDLLNDNGDLKNPDLSITLGFRTPNDDRLLVNIEFHGFKSLCGPRDDYGKIIGKISKNLNPDSSKAMNINVELGEVSKEKNYHSYWK